MAWLGWAATGLVFAVILAGSRDQLSPRIGISQCTKDFTICGVTLSRSLRIPSFLFPTIRHKEALAALYYGVRRQKGFVVLTGEVGTGKTLLVRWLLQLLKGTNVAYAYVFNSRLSSLEFLQFIAGDLGLETSSQDQE